MKISALRLHNVKRFAGRGVAIEGIGEGVSVLCAPNEHGKSTSFEALHALFFQPHTGVPADVRRMQPYSGGNPLIQADIETDAGRFRLTKQFIGGRRATVEDLGSGRLVAQADEAESFIAGLIRGGSAGPAGLLWVRQGITGIEPRRKQDEEGERQVRESLLSSVQGEVEAITGGRRMAEIMAACAEELARLVTPTGRPKAGGPYDAAIAERDRLAAEEARLAGEVAALREALDERERVMRRLAELEDTGQEAGRVAAVAAAETTLQAARAHADALKAAEAEAALSRRERDTVARERDDLHEAMRTAEGLRAGLRTAEARLREVGGRRDAALAAIGKAAAEVRTAEDEEQAARELFDRLDAALKAREAARELHGLRDRLAKAEVLRGEIEAGEAALALVAVPAATVEKLHELEIGIARLRAAEEAGRPSLLMTYDDAAPARLVLDGEPVPDGAERPFGEAARLDIPGFGTATLRSSRPAGPGKALADAEAKRDRLLAGIGVTSLAAARDRQNGAQALATRLESLRDRLGTLAPDGLATLREEIARRAGTAAGPEGPDAVPPEFDGDPGQARTALLEAGRKVRDSRGGAREVEALRAELDQAHAEARAACAAMQARLADVEARLGPPAGLDDRIGEIAARLTALQARFEEREAHAAGLRATAPDIESAEAALARTRSAETAARQEATRLRERLAELNGRIRTRADDAVEELWREAAEALAAASERVVRFETEVAVLDRLRDVLQSARAEARDLYLEPVIRELRPLLGLLFDDVSIVFDEKTLLPQAIRRAGLEEDVDRLSGGMREQLSVLTRLAFARLLAGDGRPAPVILDDALVYSDDDRIERMFDALHRQSRGQQIIVFSCRQRAFARLGGTVLHMTDWQPDAG